MLEAMRKRANSRFTRRLSCRRTTIAKTANSKKLTSGIAAHTVTKGFLSNTQPD
ncbi:hypothetical protein ACFLVY_00235 [Chloroflexota bacterium]